jgi:hypothetical protein
MNEQSQKIEIIVKPNLDRQQRESSDATEETLLFSKSIYQPYLSHFLNVRRISDGEVGTQSNNENKDANSSLKNLTDETSTDKERNEAKERTYSFHFSKI